MINITHSPSHGVLMAFVGTSFLWSKTNHEVIMFEQISPHGWVFFDGDIPSIHGQ